MPVVAVAHQVQVKAETVNMDFRRPGKREPTVRRMSGIVNVERFTAAVAGCDILNLKGQDIGDRGGALERLDVDLNWFKLSGSH